MTHTIVHFFGFFRRIELTPPSLARLSFSTPNFHPLLDYYFLSTDFLPGGCSSIASPEPRYSHGSSSSSDLPLGGCSSHIDNIASPSFDVYDSAYHGHPFYSTDPPLGGCSSHIDNIASPGINFVDPACQGLPSHSMNYLFGGCYVASPGSDFLDPAIQDTPPRSHPSHLDTNNCDISSTTIALPTTHDQHLALPTTHDQHLALPPSMSTDPSNFSPKVSSNSFDQDSTKLFFQPIFGPLPNDAITNTHTRDERLSADASRFYTMMISNFDSFQNAIAALLASPDSLPPCPEDAPPTFVFSHWVFPMSDKHLTTIPSQISLLITTCPRLKVVQSR